MAGDGQRIEWGRITKLQGLFDEYAAKQTDTESRRALLTAANRLFNLADLVHNGSYGEIDGKPATTVEEAMSYVLKPLEIVSTAARDKFNKAASDAFDDILFSYNGPKVLEVLSRIHDVTAAASTQKQEPVTPPVRRASNSPPNFAFAFYPKG